MTSYGDMRHNPDDIMPHPHDRKGGGLISRSIKSWHKNLNSMAIQIASPQVQLWFGVKISSTRPSMLPLVHRPNAFNLRSFVVSHSALSIQRTLKSVNKYRGSLHVAVTNNRGSDMRTMYLETLPWFVQLYLHTVRVECNGTRRGSIPFHTIDDGIRADCYVKTLPEQVDPPLLLPSGAVRNLTTFLRCPLR